MLQRLLGAYLLVGLVGLWSVPHFVGRKAESLLLAECEENLRQVAALLADELSPTDTELDNRVDELSRALRLWITVIDAAGGVVADSRFSGEALRRLENHGDRPEVVQARRSGTSTLVRYSTSLEQTVVYTAQKLPGPDSAVVRVAVPWDYVTAPVGDLRSVAFVTSALLWLAGGGLLWLVGRAWGEAVRKLDQAAASLAEGNWSGVVSVSQPSELASLARRLEQAALSWSRQRGLLEAERDRLSAVLNGMSEGVLVVDREGTVIAANAALERVLGVRKPVLGRAPVEVMRHPKFADGFQAVLAGEGRKEAEIYFSGRSFLIRFSPVVGDGSELEGAVAVLNDITELRRLQTVQKDFISNVSHELRTPLTSIQGYAETLLDEDVLSPIQRRFLEKIVRNSRMLSTVVDDLLGLARLERSKDETARGWIDFQGLAEEIRQDFAEALQERGLVFRVEVPPDGVRFQAARGLIHRVLHNLVENAVKYTDRGSVTLTARRETHEWVFSVADTGTGIPEEHLDKIFERFYRVEQDRSRHRGGTGVGLAIVRHIVQLHGGRVWAESRLHQGTKIHFTIPVQTAGGEESEREQAAKTIESSPKSDHRETRGSEDKDADENGGHHRR